MIWPTFRGIPRPKLWSPRSFARNIIRLERPSYFDTFGLEFIGQGCPAALSLRGLCCRLWFVLFGNLWWLWLCQCWLWRFNFSLTFLWFQCGVFRIEHLICSTTLFWLHFIFPQFAELNLPSAWGAFRFHAGLCDVRRIMVAHCLLIRHLRLELWSLGLHRWKVYLFVGGFGNSFEDCCCCGYWRLRCFSSWVLCCILFPCSRHVRFEWKHWALMLFARWTKTGWVIRTRWNVERKDGPEVLRWHS